MAAHRIRAWPSFISFSGLLFLRWPLLNAIARNRGLARRLLLLQHQLPLLHFLQHFLRSLYAGLIGIGWLLLFCFGCRLICIFVSILFRRVRLIRFRSWLLRGRDRLSRRHDSKLLLFCDRRATGGSHRIRPGFHHQHNASERRIIRRRSKQHIIKPRTIQQFSEDFACRARPEMGYDTLRGGRNINLGAGLFFLRPAKCLPRSSWAQQSLTANSDNSPGARLEPWNQAGLPALAGRLVRTGGQVVAPAFSSSAVRAWSRYRQRYPPQGTKHRRTGP